MKKEKSYLQKYRYAKSLATRWRLTKKVIYERLILKGSNSIEANKIINRLLKEGYINERMNFSSQVFALEEKRYGYRRIKDKLISYGYTQELLATYTFNKDIELDNCRYFFNKIVKKYKDYRYSDAEREKIINYLKRYGFNDKIIYEVIKIGINYEDVS